MILKLLKSKFCDVAWNSNLASPACRVMHCISLKVSPLFLRRPRWVSDVYPQPSLSATATVRCLLLGQKPLEEASLLVPLTLGCQCLPRKLPLEASVAARPLGKGEENLLLSVSKGSQEKMITLGFYLSSSTYLDRDQGATWTIQWTNLYWLPIMCLVLVHRLGIQ